MNKIKYLILVIISFVVGISSISFAANLPDTIANVFPDPNLAQAIASTFSGSKTTGSMVTQDDLNTIITLIATGKNIVSISGIETLKNIEYIDFNFNAISGTLPSLFSGLTHLSGLILQNNRISSLPEDVFSGMINCKKLRISFNKISYFPPKVFSPLINIEDLAMGRNLNTNIPETIYSGLSGLKYLYTEYSFITGLSIHTFSGLINLKVLYLNNNQITDLPEGIFSGLKNLELLLIGGNLFKTLNPRLLWGLTELKDFRVAINQLTTLDPNFFSGILKLTYIRLDNNKFKYLPNNLFSGMTNLTGILLYTNQLRNLPIGIFNNMPLLSKVTIHNNCLTTGILDNNIYTTILSTNAGIFPTQYAIGSTYCSTTTGVLIADINNIGNELIWMGYKQGTGALKSVSSNVFVGNKSLDVSEVSGNLLVPIILQSSGSINKYEAEFSSGTFIKTASGANFTGLLTIPVLKSTGVVSGVSGNVLSVASFGSTTPLIFKDQSNNDRGVIIRMPALGMNSGDLVKILYSQNNWISKTTQTYTYVTMINGSPYVEFTTTHFTDFAVLGFGTGTFVINNDDATTSTRNVVLNIYHPLSGSNIRFSNTNNFDGISRESYTTTKSWTLSNSVGSKTVYVEFDTNNDGTADATVSDIIDYAPLPVAGNLSLEISGGVSECIYGTSLNLGEQSAKIDTAYSFTGDFTGGNWMCTDYKASNLTRSFTIQTSDLTNGKGNSISSGLVELNHSTGSVSGDPKCRVGIATGNNWSLINTPYTIMERSSGGEQVCKVTIPRVSMRIGIPANQAPGVYSGTLTLTIQGL